MKNINIAVDGDLTIEVTEYETIRGGSSDKKAIKEEVQFLTKFDVITSNSVEFEERFRRLGVKKNGIFKVDEYPKRFEICLRVLHKCSQQHQVYATSTKDIYFVIEAAKRYKLDISLFRDWFLNSRTKISNPDIREMIYPAWEFDTPKSFASYTKHLCYHNAGHVMEGNPTHLKELHLPPRIVQQLNAAKGRLRTILHYGLFGPNEQLLKATCKCRKETLYDYEKHLFSIDVWPLEQFGQKASISQILDRLAKFSSEPNNSVCNTCRYPQKRLHYSRMSGTHNSYKTYIKAVVDDVRSYFDGLCLDCLDKSQVKLRDTNEDYWRQASLNERESCRGCRIVHKQPTWYFSFMGRYDERERRVSTARSDRYDSSYSPYSDFA